MCIRDTGLNVPDRFSLEVTGIQRFMLFRQPGLPRKDPQMAACILIKNFFIYGLSKERIITILNPGQLSISRNSSDPSNKCL